LNVILNRTGCLFIKRIEKRDIDFFRRNITAIDKKMLDYVNTAYDVLHKDGYYDGITDVVIVSRGFEVAYIIINKIKPVE